MEQPGIHGAEAPDWPPAADDTDGEPTASFPAVSGLDEPTLELPVVAPAQHGPRRYAILAGAAVLVLVAVLIVRSGDGPSGGRVASRPSEPAGSWKTSPRPVAATFVVAGGVPVIRLRTADLGAELYRVDTPGGTPQVTTQGGQIRLSLADPPGRVDVTLAAGVRWDLKIGGNVDLSTIDLTGAVVHAVDLTGGASHVDLTLPRPDGTLIVRMTGGVGRFDVHSAQHVPVRVRVGSGAGRVVLDGLRHDGVAAGALFTPDRWAGAVNRVDVDAAAGMSALTVASY